jgi:hypothetical protein
MIMSGVNLGIDLGNLVKSAESAGESLVTQDLPNALTKTVTSKVQSVATPVVQQLVQQKASNVVSQGQMALWAGTAGGAGVLIGALMAGGSWKRRAVGGGILGAILAGAGAFASFKIGMLKSSA